MGQILVRNVDDRIVSRLKARARKRGRSLQAEVRNILEQESRTVTADAWTLADSIRKSFGGRKFEDSAKIIRKLRDSR